MRYIWIGIVSLLVSGCGDVMVAKFSTLSECLSSMKSISSGPLKIARDTPSIVSGNLANGKTFACERKVTGTSGTYYEGWYNE
ncbi:hypothetical protein VSX61_08720 [Brenneria populi subsp. brevivirga]|uniref:hypothetical protein n=1 Tax=Brenneria populi TaxID=1505588 RepID=UPI002E179E04|nr:hypothetical protein [Brenneria populi subsp. brevivirga]